MNKDSHGVASFAGNPSRRQFVVGATAAAGAAAMIATIPGIATAEEAAESEEPAEGEASGATSQIDTDVLVIGAGVAGLTAAISAAEEGAKVLLIEKDAGLKPVYAHSITAIGTSFQEEMGEDWSAQELVDFWNQYGDDFMDTDAQLFAAEHSGESIEWLMAHGVDIVGVTVPPTNPFQVPARTFVTSADRDGVKAYLEPLTAKAQEDGVEIMFSVEATAINKVDGAITGITATGPDGEMTINAKSVIVCSGGFGGSSEMLRLYAPLTPNGGTFEGASTGFAIQQSRGIGAEVVAPGGTMAYFLNVDGGYSDNPGQGLFVTREGKRWVNENLYFLDRAGIAYREGISEYWALYDKALFDEVAASTAEQGLKNGSIVEADTIEELAIKMGVNVANLVETVETYNGYCAEGSDPDFGKPATRPGRVFDPEDPKEYDLDLIDKEFKLLNPLEQGPFYAIDLTVQTTALSGTTGGMRTDTNGQVIGVDGSPIPNLYAAGEAANGHLIGYFYPQSGTSLCMCFCFGRYAGISAAQNALA